jgi:hypothetical protein
MRTTLALITLTAAAVMARVQEPIEAVASHPPEDWTYILLFAGALGLAALVCGVGVRVQLLNVVTAGLVIGGGAGWLAWIMGQPRALTVGAGLAAILAIVGFLAGGRRDVRKFLRGNARPQGWITDTPSRAEDPENWPKRPPD